MVPLSPSTDQISSPLVFLSWGPFAFSLEIPVFELVLQVKEAGLVRLGMQFSMPFFDLSHASFAQKGEVGIRLELAKVSGLGLCSRTARGRGIGGGVSPRRPVGV